MKSMRGIIALVVAVVFGLLSAKMVANYVKRPDVETPPPPPKVERTAPVSPSLPYGVAIPEGMRAVSIPVDEVTGVSRSVKRGDRVDVIAVSNIPGKGGGRISRLILEAVEVLAAAPERGGGDSRNTVSTSRQVTKWVVTLLLTPTDAAIVTAADASGKLALTVRNPRDLKADAKTTAMAFTSEGGALPYVDPRHSPPMEEVRGLIKPGMRAFTLEAKVTDGAAGNIRPGDRVDLVLTCPFDHFASAGSEVGAEGRVTSTHMASRIFLQNIEILAVADQERLVTPARYPVAGEAAEVSPAFAPSSELLKERIATVVLHVTPEEAELLTVATDATSKSVIRLLLRNPGDDARVATSGQLLIELLTEKREYTRVELLRGNEKTTRKFFQYTKGGIAARSEGFLKAPVDNPEKEEKE